MSTLRIILHDQLSRSISSLDGVDKKHDTILMCESKDYWTHIKHHKKKIVFVLSAMRHFAEELKKSGHKLKYIKIGDSSSTGTLTTDVKQVCKSKKITKIVVTRPSEHWLDTEISSWQNTLKIEVDVQEDNRFLCSEKEFQEWAKDKKKLMMENFYRLLRKKHNILMNGEKPLGGKWNYDTENRKPASDGKNIPKPYHHAPDDVTKQVARYADKHFADHFGDTEPFQFAVTRLQALQALKSFIDQRLKFFGTYQDAMLQDEPWMFHSHIGLYLNSGLLLPLECIEAAEQAYRDKKAPINSVEGFIRQILGWREYIRGIYWLKMPGYARQNHLDAKRQLPEFYWTADTKMNCLSQCVSQTKTQAYAHHIQRLMVLGNFALIAGINPKQVNEWFWIVYVDAYQWVELPNVSGMILYADGGFMTSKPYAASGNYINKMSNYCKHCQYKVTEKNGPEACPFNYLYWDFLARNKEKLKKNPRMGMPYRTYNNMSQSKKETIAKDAKHFLSKTMHEKSQPTE